MSEKLTDKLQNNRDVTDQDTNPKPRSLKEIEQEAIRKRQASGLKPTTSKRAKGRSVLTKRSNTLSNMVNKELSKSNKLQPLSVANPPADNDVDFEDLFDPNFEQELQKVEEQVKEDIKAKRISLFPPEIDANLKALTSAFDEVATEVSSELNYQIVSERKVQYSQELDSAKSKLERLEQSIDYETYQNELRLSEFEDSQLRINRYRKRKLEGLDELGGVAEADHNTEEKNVDIGLRRNTDFSVEDQPGEKRSKREEDIVRRDFVQDYEGSDLDNVDKERDKLEAQILSKQKLKTKRRGKTDEEKIAEAKERLRKKQEKRLAKKNKKNKNGPVAEIDLVGNQFDASELQEERMDRLLEIKRISAQKKELQKQKEAQRTKATKEFYKYKKVNKKSHIVGFKQ